MEQKYADDTFLARWLANDLSEKELILFKTTSEYKEYLKIVKAMGVFEQPDFDQEKVLQKIQQKTQSKGVVKKLIPNWMYVAASITILFSVVYFTTNINETFTTSYGEQLQVMLPDGSEVRLNAKSKLSYNKSDWKKGFRNLKLEGEGYFKVKKGSEFKVKTTKGNISVLGTQFNIKQTNSYFEVYCYEGKVRVENEEEKVILTKGLSFRKIKGNASEKSVFIAENPSWISGESTFNKVSLKLVLEELEKQYNITIVSNNINKNQLYTGSFSNSNLNLALQTISEPLAIHFKVEKTIVTLTRAND